MAKEFSTRRIAIDKAYATVVTAVAVAAFLVVFSLVASKALLDQRAYQSKVISKKEIALQTLKNNIGAADQLISSYTEFVGAPTNVLNGNPNGDGDRDGDNARIVLDALPSKYDFPALTSSVDKLFRENNIVVGSITGDDQEIEQSAVVAAQVPQPIEMPFTVEIDTAAKDGKKLLGLFERSIRPFQIRKLSITGDESSITVGADVVTFFQPEKNLDLKTEVVK